MDKAIAKTDAGYAIIDDDKVRIMVTVSYYDQYGNPAASGDRLTITVNNPDDTSDDGAATTGTERRPGEKQRNRQVHCQPQGRRRRRDQAVTISTLETASTVAAPTVDAVLAVRHAHKNDDGVSGNRAARPLTKSLLTLITTGSSSTPAQPILMWSVCCTATTRVTRSSSTTPKSTWTSSRKRSIRTGRLSPLCSTAPAEPASSPSKTLPKPVLN